MKKFKKLIKVLLTLGFIILLTVTSVLGLYYSAFIAKSSKVTLGSLNLKNKKIKVTDGKLLKVEKSYWLTAKGKQYIIPKNIYFRFDRKFHLVNYSLLNVVVQEKKELELKISSKNIFSSMKPRHSLDVYYIYSIRYMNQSILTLKNVEILIKKENSALSFLKWILPAGNLFLFGMVVFMWYKIIRESILKKLFVE